MPGQNRAAITTERHTMATEKIKPAHKHTKSPTPKQEKILTLKTQHPEASSNAIAKMAGSDTSYTIEVLQRYGLIQQNVNDYKNHRADILSGLQHRLISSITQDEIQKSPIGTRVLAACQLYDKERLERGMSSENIQLIHADIAKIKGMQKQE